LVTDSEFTLDQVALNDKDRIESNGTLLNNENSNPDSKLSITDSGTTSSNSYVVIEREDIELLERKMTMDYKDVLIF